MSHRSTGLDSTSRALWWFVSRQHKCAHNFKSHQSFQSIWPRGTDAYLLAGQLARLTSQFSSLNCRPAALPSPLDLATHSLSA
ncbi:unnamed protein product, partial [Protopolystoma xenopodis]